MANPSSAGARTRTATRAPRRREGSTGAEFNGDGYRDLAVAQARSGGTGQPIPANGLVQVLYGSARGFTAAASQRWSSSEFGLDTSQAFCLMLTSGLDIRRDATDQPRHPWDPRQRPRRSTIRHCSSHRRTLDVKRRLPDVGCRRAGLQRIRGRNVHPRRHQPHPRIGDGPHNSRQRRVECEASRTETSRTALRTDADQLSQAPSIRYDECPRRGVHPRHAEAGCSRRRDGGSCSPPW